VLSAAPLCGTWVPRTCTIPRKKAKNILHLCGSYALNASGAVGSMDVAADGAGGEAGLKARLSRALFELNLKLGNTKSGALMQVRASPNRAHSPTDCWVPCAQQSTPARSGPMRGRCCPLSRSYGCLTVQRMANRCSAHRCGSIPAW
jgi:hypothetical protein